jgi:GT2 family glycosyltransferase
LPTADFIKYHTINYGNPHLGAVAGKIKLIKDVKRPFTIFRSNLTGGKIVLSGRYIYNWESNEKVYTFSACGANMSFRKSLFERVGRFDTRFSIAPEYYEDVDFCYRLRKLGFKIIFEPNAMVLHQLYPTGGCRTEDNIKNEHSRFKNAILFYLKNMNKLFLPYMLLVFFLIAIKKILLPTRSLKDFVYVLSGLWCGFKTYNIAMPGID